MKISLPSLFTIFIFSFIYSQGKIESPSGRTTESNSFQSAEHPTLLKTQGSSKSDNVYCSLQDKAGNLWFGTTGEGVYRFNGNSFTQFTKSAGLSSNSVYSLLEDASGNIWMGTSEGLCRFDGKKITSISFTDFSLSLNGDNTFYSRQSTKNSVWSMLQDKTGKIWFGTGDGVFYYNGKSFIRFLQNDGVINKQNLHLKMIDCMLQDKIGNIWFASGMPPGEEGVCLYDGKSITSFKPNGDGWIRYIKEDKKGNLWFGGRSHGNFIYDGKIFKNFTEKVGIGNPVLIDRSGNIWFNGEEKLSSVESDSGIWRYDGKTFKNFNTVTGMSNYFVWNMLEDRNGNIWIGTRNTGLYKYDGKTFTKFSE